MPVVHPFRALRYDADAVGDIGLVVAPPYDVIGADERRDLLARSPFNVVRLEFPAAEMDDVDPDDMYRRAGRLLSKWRGDGVMGRDARPSIYVYEQQFQRPGDDAMSVRRGFFARVGLVPFGTGVLPHERTMPGPREDRYRLLRATNVNTSPVVAVYEDATGRVAQILADVAGEPPVVDVADMIGERNRLWVLPSGADGRAELLAGLASRAPLTIADGHHRYETALRFQAERRVGGPADPENEAGFEFVLMLLLEAGAGPLVVLPTHRVVRGLGPEGLAALGAGLAPLFDIEGHVAARDLVRTFGRASAGAPAEGGRIGLWTRGGGSILLADRAAFEPILPPGGTAVRHLDVSLLGAVLESVVGLDALAVAGGSRLTYTKDAAEAVALVDAGVEGADAAFLLDPTPAADMVAVAAAGDVMPQKSTYIYPKAITGLVINPLEG
ncbi:MAG: DUF1015 domain-containing protein [Chloroflexi bacterium]|nr:DUF1015 domain-containing protein [Chloroflexota bacterium]